MDNFATDLLAVAFSLVLVYLNSTLLAHSAPEVLRCIPCRGASCRSAIMSEDMSGLTSWTTIGIDKIGLLILIVVLAQGPAIWTHNALEWTQFFGLETDSENVRSLVQDTIWFLVSLVGLMSLYRTMALRRLDDLLLARQVGADDRNGVMVGEGIVLAGLMICGGILAFLMVLTASSLGRHQGILAHSPWSVMTVGGSAAVLFVCALFVWLKRR